MKVIYYDLILLGIFLIFIVQFLIRNRHNLKRDGLLILYRTKWGMNLIDRTGKKYKKTLKFLSYVSITVGYLLMAGILWMFGKIIYLYVAYPAVVRAIKVPPITPLIPYFDRIVPQLGLPSFYFIYWILILAVIAIFHEFAHGIFMRRYDIKIKSTGFGFFPFFLPVFLAAFVEQDEKSMNRKKIFPQLAVLSAGTFANIITAAVFFLVMILFFSIAFVPAGVQFNTYSYSAIDIGSINNINGDAIEGANYQAILSLSNETGWNEVVVSGGGKYIFEKEMWKEQGGGSGFVYLYDDAPAIREKMTGAIVEVEGVRVSDWNVFASELNKYSPGDEVEITTANDSGEFNYEIVLGEHPNNPNRPFLGVGYSPAERKGLIGKFVDYISSFKKDHIYYQPKWEVSDFVYDFLWWLVLISFSVALVNMLPMGIFDGGRFFYLTILWMTKSERKAERWFRGVTKFLLFLVLALMLFWAWSFIG